MNGVFILLMIVVFVLGWVGVGLYIGIGKQPVAPKQDRTDPTEWPVIARSTNEQEIYLIESTLQADGIEVIAETENPNAVQGAISALRNEIRVPPSLEDEARDCVVESGNEELLVD